MLCLDPWYGLIIVSSSDLPHEACLKPKTEVVCTLHGVHAIMVHVAMLGEVAIVTGTVFIWVALIITFLVPHIAPSSTISASLYKKIEKSKINCLTMHLKTFKNYGTNNIIKYSKKEGWMCRIILLIPAIRSQR